MKVTMNKLSVLSILRHIYQSESEIGSPSKCFEVLSKHISAKLFNRAISSVNVSFAFQLAAELKKDITNYPNDSHALHDYNYLKVIQQKSGQYCPAFVMYGDVQDPVRYSDLNFAIDNIKKALNNN